MNTIHVSYTTELSPAPSALELRLALENAKMQYGAACMWQSDAWLGYEEAIDDGNREAVADFLRVATLADAVQADAYQELQIAYAAYWARVN